MRIDRELRQTDRFETGVRNRAITITNGANRPCYESTTTRLRIESPRSCVSGDAPDVQNSADPDDTKYQNLYCKKDIPLPGSSLHIFVLPEGTTVS